MKRIAYHIVACMILFPQDWEVKSSDRDIFSSSTELEYLFKRNRER